MERCYGGELSQRDTMWGTANDYEVQRVASVVLGIVCGAQLGGVACC